MPNIKKPKGRRGSGPAKIKPFPELLPGERGRSWKVEEGEDAYTSMVSYSSKIMRVPMKEGECTYCSTDHADHIRTHEMLHARISPLGTPRTTFVRKGKKVPVREHYIHMMEEWRIDLFGYHTFPSYLPYCVEEMQEVIFSLVASRKYRDALELEFVLFSIGHQRLWYAFHALFEQKLAKALVGYEPEEHDEPWRDFFDLWWEEPERFYKKLKSIGYTDMQIEEIFGIFKVYSDISGSYYWLMSAPVSKHGDQIPRMTWSEVLRGAYELQRRFENFSSHADSVFASGQADSRAIKADIAKDAAAARAARMDSGAAMTNRASQVVQMAQHMDGEKKLIEIEEMPDTDIESELYIRDGVAKRIKAGARGTGTTIKWPPMRMLTPRLTDAFPPHKLQRSRSMSSDEGVIPRSMSRLLVDGKVFGRKKRFYGASVLVDDSGSMGFMEHNLEMILDSAPASIVGVYSGSGGRTGGHLKIIAKDGKRLPKGERIGTPGGGNEVDLPALEWLAQFPGPRIWYSDGQAVVSGQSMSDAMLECEQFCEAAGIIRVNSVEALDSVINGRIPPRLPKLAKYKKTWKKPRGMKG